MPNEYKAVFLPFDERILALYTGHMLKGEMLVDIQYDGIFRNKKIKTNKELSIPQKMIRIILFILLILLIPLVLIVLLIASIFKKVDPAMEVINKYTDLIFYFFINIGRDFKLIYKGWKCYEDVVWEDVPCFLKHCKRRSAKIFIYTYNLLTDVQQSKLERLIESGLIDGYRKIEKLSDLNGLIEIERLAADDSFLVVKNISGIKEAEKFGEDAFFEKYPGRIALWGKHEFCDDEREYIYELNSEESLVDMRQNVEYYVTAKDRLFFQPKYVLFIEDEYNPDLNRYVQMHYDRINGILQKKGMRLLYYPFAKGDEILNEMAFNLLRYRYPALYGLSQQDLRDGIESFLDMVSPDQFYRFVIGALDLPYFPKPAFLRNIADGSVATQHKFTYTHLKFNDEESLNELVNWYLDQVNIGHDRRDYYSKILSPEEYNADWFFSRDSRTLPKSLKQYIDRLKEEGNHAVLVEAMLYLIETIKNENPSIVEKIKPIIEKGGLLQSPASLSPLVVDSRYKIFFPGFGNIEVKMSPLPKALYLFFLNHPEGIRLPELFEYKQELVGIYGKITGRQDNNGILSSIDKLVDMREPLINQKCSRIRAAFRELMDESFARYYYIDGERGEPKKIALLRQLIDLRY